MVDELRFHILRHTAVSMLFLQKYDPVRIARMVGDTPTTGLKTYAHFIRDSGDEMATALDGFRGSSTIVEMRGSA